MLSISTQESLKLIKRPRVVIQFGVEIGDAIRQVSLPFMIAVITDIGGDNKNDNMRNNEFINVDRDNLDKFIEQCGAVIRFSVANKLDSILERLAVELYIKSVDDLEPISIIKQIPLCNSYYNLMTSYREIMIRVDMSPDEQLEHNIWVIMNSKDNMLAIVKEIDAYQKDGSILDAIDVNFVTLRKLLFDSHLVLDVNSPNTAIILDYLRNIIKHNLSIFDLAQHSSLRFLIQYNLSSINYRIGLQLDEIMQHRKYKDLASNILGLQYLVMNTYTSEDLLIHVLNTSKEAIDRDLQKAVQFDQSRLFKLVYEGGFGTLGGKPYSTIVLALNYFNCNSNDVAMLRLYASVAAATHAILLAGVDPTMFDIRDFKNINDTRDLTKRFSSVFATEYKSFRECEDSRYVGLVLPKILARQPYSDDFKAKDISYKQWYDPENSDTFLWFNGAYTVASLVSRSMLLYGWPSAFTGVENGGLIENLPVFIYKDEFGVARSVCPTECNISDRVENQLSTLGFITICNYKDTTNAVIFSAKSCHKPEFYDKDFANANSQLSSQLESMYIVSKFVHAINVMLRNKIGSFTGRDELQTFLQNWISQYVLLGSSTSLEVLARSPLSGAKIEVIEKPGKTGAYAAIISIKSHFRLVEVDVVIRTVAQLPE